MQVNSILYLLDSTPTNYLSNFIKPLSDTNIVNSITNI